jgi:hypothetical protein
MKKWTESGQTGVNRVAVAFLAEVVTGLEKDHAQTHHLPSWEGNVKVTIDKQIYVFGYWSDAVTKKVAFHAHGITAGSRRSTQPTFHDVVENIGNNYNSTTGTFTCKVPDVYYFTISPIYGYRKDDISCFLKIQSLHTYDVYVKIRKPEYRSNIITASGVFHLYSGDTVYVDRCGEYYKTSNYIAQLLRVSLLAPDSRLLRNISN